MIDEAQADLSVHGGLATLDALFSRAAFRSPASYALIDAPNRASFATGAPRYITYAAADRAICAVAARLQQFGLPRGSVVALQFPNMAEGAIALLGVLRAGMIAAPLPCLWRRADMILALTRLGAKAIIAGGRIGEDELCNVALGVAAEVFPIRYVCTFGARAADGAISFDALLAADKLDPLIQAGRADANRDEPAVVTWDTTAERPEGPMPIARSHAQLIAAGLAVVLEGRIDEGATILAVPGQASLSGLASTVLPWLICGGTLHLHNGLDADVLAAQILASECDTVVLPGQLTAPIHHAGMLARRHLRNVIGVWRTPERVAASPVWRHDRARLTDVQGFGEGGLIAGQRQASGRSEPFAVGALKVPRDSARGLPSIEISRSERGTLLLRGPMVPRDASPFGPESGEGPSYKADPAGYADTGYPCRIERETRALVLTGPPAGLVNVGGYRFVQRALQDQLGPLAQEATLAALPDPLLSHRLAGRAIDRSEARGRLTADGANALVVAAFRDRRKPQAA